MTPNGEIFMTRECSECGTPFHTVCGQGQIFCSVHCQLKRDPLECDAVHKTLRSRAAKTPPRIPKTNIPAC